MKHAKTADGATNADHATNADSVPPLSFRSVTLKNGWAGNSGECGGYGAPGVAKSSEGVVYFHGGVCRKSGSSNNPFAVPADLAPSMPEYIPVDQGPYATGLLLVLTNGEVDIADDVNVPGSGAVITLLGGASYTLPY